MGRDVHAVVQNPQDQEALGVRSKDKDMAGAGDAVAAWRTADAGPKMIEEQAVVDDPDTGSLWIFSQIRQGLIDQPAVAMVDDPSEGFAAVTKRVSQIGTRLDREVDTPHAARSANSASISASISSRKARTSVTGIVSPRSA